MRAMSVLSFDTGTSTRWCLAAAALRRRVRKSAMGSVCIILLPARFHYARDFSAQRHATETDAAHLEFANVPACAAAAAGTVGHAYFELGLLASLGDLCCACHLLSRPSFAKRNPEPLQQLAALLVVCCRCRQRDVHALDLVHAGVINLREDQLVLEAKRVVAAAIESVRGQAAEVAHARQHRVAQAGEKFVHAVATQSDGAADGHALANFEVRNGLLGPRDHRFLPGDL